MPSVAEGAGVASQLEAAVTAGLRSLDKNQQLTFTQYQRTILPADGYLFWLNTGTTFQVSGSLHYAVDLQQNEDETVALNRITFTCETEVQEFNSIAPGILWIANIGSQAESNSAQAPGLSGLTPSPVLFAFSARDKYFRKANAFHYVGTAVQPALLAQLVDSPNDIPSEPIVGDSLPIWLSLTQFAPVYPSFLVPQNVEPPYIVAHIPPESTEAWQAFASFDPTPLFPPTTALQALNSTQLLREHVKLTLYGFNHQTASQYLQYLIQSSVNLDTFGFVGELPVLRDQKRRQPEIQALAMKKVIEFDISYFQQTAEAIAVRLILSAGESFTVPGRAPTQPQTTFSFLAGPLSSQISFSRPGIAWDSLVRQYGANVPRFDSDPVTGALKGLMIEAASTNGLPDSAVIEGANNPVPFVGSGNGPSGRYLFGPGRWITSGSTLTGGQTGPDGQPSASLFTDSATVQGTIVDSPPGPHLIFPADGVDILAPTFPALGTQTGSLFLKAGTARYVRVALDSNGFGDPTNMASIDVDLVAGTLSNPLSTGGWTYQSSEILPWGSGWWRIVLTAVTTNNNGWLSLFMMSAPGVITYAATGALNVLVAYPDVEPGLFASSPMPTPPPTNLLWFASDFPSLWTAGSKHNPTNGTLTLNAALAPDGTTRATMLTDNSTNGEHTVWSGAGGLVGNHPNSPDTLFDVSHNPPTTSAWYVHAGPPPPQLDGSASLLGSSGSSGAVTLSTSNPNDVIIVAIEANEGSGVLSVTDAAGLIWTQRALVSPVPGHKTIATYWAIAPHVLTGDVITVRFNASTSFLSISAFGVSGANTSAPFDTNSGLPATTTSGPVAVSTNSQNSFVFAAYRIDTPGPTALSPFTTITGGGSGFMLTEYFEAYTQQSNLSCVASSYANGSFAGIGDAIVPAVQGCRYVQLRAGDAAQSYLDFSPNPQSPGDLKVDVDLVAGTISSPGDFGLNPAVYINSTIEALPNAQFPNAPPGWYRISITGQINAENIDFNRIVMENGLGNTSYAGSGAVVYVWRPTIEQNAPGNTPTPFSNSNGSVARPGDVATTAVLNAAAFAQSIQAITAPGIGTVPQILAQHDDGTENNRITVERDTNRHLKVIVAASGAVVATLDLGAISDETLFAVAYSATAGAFAASLNGGAAVTASAPMPAGLATKRLGSNSAGVNQWGGWIQEDSEWAYALTAQQLQVLSVP